jgi:thiol-disulfide isomerase/thioredoxin
MLNALVGYGFGMDMTQNMLVHFGEQVGDFLSQGLTTLPTEYLDLMNEVETRELLHPQGMVSRDAVTYFRDVINLESMRQKGFISMGADDEGDMGLDLITRVYPITIIDSIDVSDDVRELMKTFYYLDKCGDEMTAERDAFLHKHLNTKSYELLMGYLENKKMKFAAPVKEEIETLTEMTLDSLTDGQEIFQKLILPYRGRVVYVDVWGTWCGPCREEMEHLPSLHETLQGLPVTYMYLANNSPEELWQKSTVRYGLNHADCVNLRLSNSQQQAVEHYLKVHGYPTYVIVAPDGTIVNNDAPRPSEASSVRKAILKLIEK